MIQFKEYLSELFDKPWSKEIDHNKTTQAKEIYKNSEIHKNDEISNVKVYKLEGNNGHMISYHRNGCVEVHHHDDSGNSGVLHANAKHGNPRFISTMKAHLVDEGLNKGYPVRLLTANEKMADHYQKIANGIVSKNSTKSWKIKRYKTNIGGRDIHNIEIHPFDETQEQVGQLLSTKSFEINELQF